MEGEDGKQAITLIFNIFPTLREFGEVNWCPGTLTIQMEDCQVKKFVLLGQTALCSGKGVMESTHCCIRLNYLTWAESLYFCGSEISSFSTELYSL